MTLLIACLLIYHLDLAWGWYCVATVVWIGHLGFHPSEGQVVKLHQLLERRAW